MIELTEREWTILGIGGACGIVFAVTFIGILAWILESMTCSCL